MVTKKRTWNSGDMPDNSHLPPKERAEKDAAFFRSVGYKHVKIVKHGRGYRVEASSIKEK